MPRIPCSFQTPPWGQGLCLPSQYAIKTEHKKKTQTQRGDPVNIVEHYIVGPSRQCISSRNHSINWKVIQMDLIQILPIILSRQPMNIECQALCRALGTKLWAWSHSPGSHGSHWVQHKQINNKIITNYDHCRKGNDQGDWGESKWLGRQWVGERDSFQERGWRPRPECQGVCSPGRGTGMWQTCLVSLNCQRSPRLDRGGRWHQTMGRGGPALEPEWGITEPQIAISGRLSSTVTAMEAARR